MAAVEQPPAKIALPDVPHFSFTNERRPALPLPKFHPGEFTDQSREHYAWLRRYTQKMAAAAAARRLRRRLEAEAASTDSDASVGAKVAWPFFPAPSPNFLPSPFEKRRTWLILPGHALVSDVILPLVWAGATFTEVHGAFQRLVLLEKGVDASKPPPNKKRLVKPPTPPTGITEAYLQRLRDGGHYKAFLAAFEKGMQLNQRVRLQMHRLAAAWLLRHRVKPVNEEDMVTLERPKQPVTIVDWPARRSYVFEARTIFRDWVGRLTMADYLYSEPQPPRNPYTNLPLTLAQTLAAYQQLVAAGCTHWTIEAYRAATFDIDTFANRHGEALRYHAVEQVFRAKDSDVYSTIMIEFIEDEHGEFDAAFNRSIYLWAMTHEPDSRRVRLWHKACYIYNRLLIEVPDPNQLREKHDQLILPITGPLCSPPTELIVLRDRWHKKQLLQARAPHSATASQ